MKMNLGHLGGGRWLGLGLGLVVLLTLLMAPMQGGTDRQGSTYSRAPSGYGAWYQHLQKNLKGRDIPLQRWQKPLQAWSEDPPPAPATLVQIYPPNATPFAQDDLLDWVEAGNTWIILSTEGTVSPAPFRTTHRTPYGSILLETRRRWLIPWTEDPEQEPQILLGDRFGAIVEQIPLGKGQVIRVASPHLGANAYQQTSGNFDFLSAIVTQPLPGNPAQPPQSLWVDEYLHGYIDPQDPTTATNPSQHWGAYLWATPLGVLAVQGLILGILVLWSQNQRFGSIVLLEPPPPNNTAAYIQALGGVLRKAESHRFVWETLHRAEVQHLRRWLGLGDPEAPAPGTVPDRSALLQAWTNQTGRSPQELARLLDRPTPLREVDLRQWLTVAQHIRQIREP